jgi:hypothetical protein
VAGSIYDAKDRRHLEAICKQEDKIADIQSRVRMGRITHSEAALALTFATAELKRLQNGGKPFGESKSGEGR